MKLLINNQITLTYKYQSGPEDFEDNAYEDWQYFLDNDSALLSNMCVDHTAVNKYTSFDLILYEQKVTLDEFAMNNLFYNVLSGFMNQYKIRYIPLGGKGCDFSIELFI